MAIWDPNRDWFGLPHVAYASARGLTDLFTVASTRRERFRANASMLHVSHWQPKFDKAVGRAFDTHRCSPVLGLQCLCQEASPTCRRSLGVPNQLAHGAPYGRVFPVFGLRRRFRVGWDSDYSPAALRRRVGHCRSN